MATNALPETGLIRLRQIIGNPKASPPIPAIIPVSRTSWLEGVKSGKYPKPVRLGPRTVAWNAEDIRALLDRLKAA
ncbi:helix-turn-helix transcriptional regulator [Methylomagnum sp.]